MREIGGYLCFEECHRPMLHDDAIALNSGRNCLAYLIEKKKITKMCLPKFLCASVGDTCRKYGVELFFYSIDNNLFPDLGDIQDSWLYIVNYFGQLTNDEIIILKNKYNKIIVDNVQAYFQEPCKGIDTIYTCRKFFGVTDGAFLYSNINLDDSLEQDISWNRIAHIAGSYELGVSCFFDRHLEEEEMFANMPIRRMSKLTNNLLHGIDYESIKTSRTVNFEYLHKSLSSVNKLKLLNPEGPYMYPLYVENGSTIRKRLQEKRIYIPTLWQDVIELCDENELEYDMAMNILPLPIDQRYDTEDMEYVLKEILFCIG